MQLATQQSTQDRDNFAILANRLEALVFTAKKNGNECLILNFSNCVFVGYVFNGECVSHLITNKGHGFYKKLGTLIACFQFLNSMGARA